jgi:hypothetical protein
MRRALVFGALAATALASGQAAAQNRQFSFAYDHPNTTAYGVAAIVFDAKPKEFSLRVPRLRFKHDTENYSQLYPITNRCPAPPTFWAFS